MEPHKNSQNEECERQRNKTYLRQLESRWKSYRNATYPLQARIGKLAHDIAENRNPVFWRESSAYVCGNA